MAVNHVFSFQLILCLLSFAFGDIDFSFHEETYAHVIKSTSKLLTPLFHVSAPHCKYGKVEYKILERELPFKISHQDGNVYLAHPLDLSGQTSFSFTVQAQDANRLCSATTQVQVFVVHVNEHKPIMSAAKYYCFVNENERTVEVRPKIKATDQDEGQAGKIRGIHIREQGIPFKVVVDKDGEAKMVATEDLDAESIMEYRFSIYAVDNGTRARKSERSKVYCNVLDVNEYAPIFEHPSYEFEVFRGRSYDRIIQVQAIDRDITSKNGKVCSYAITEDGIPFSIDTNGIISLQEELPQNYPNRTVFHLRATDCNDKVSDDDAVVRVKIKDKPSATLKSAPIHKANCKPGVVLGESSHIQYLSCSTNLQLLPDFNVNTCNDTNDHEISLRAFLDSSLVRKGCERLHGTSNSVYSKCGAKDVTDLLPNPSSNWVEDFLKEETVQGDTNYIFDGNFAARLPRNIFKEKWQDTFTIAGWVLIKTSQNPQFILSLSDGRKFSDTYVGLYAVNKVYDEQPRIGFIMNKDNGKCKFHEEWEVALGNIKWRHIAVVVDGCNLQLQVDGVALASVGIEESLQPDQSHLQPKYVIGGRWFGTSQKYTDFFNGKLSQFIFTRSVVENFGCVLKCQEGFDLLTPLPNGFQLERAPKYGSLLVSGRGRLSSLHTILNGLVYRNEEPYPTPVRRRVQIEPRVDGKLFSALDLDIEIPKSEKPKITLTGSCDNSVKNPDSIDAGMQICPDVGIKVDGCLSFLDEAIVWISSDVADSCNLSVPIPILKRFALSASFSANILRIKGLARLRHYKTVLSHVMFTPSKQAIKKTTEIKMEVSSENDRFTSNELVVSIEVEGRQTANGDYPVFFLHSKTDDSYENMIVDEKKTSAAGGNGIMIVGVLLSVMLVVFAAGFTVHRIARKRNEESSPENDLRSTDLLWDDEGLTTAINITMNPLLRFRPDSSSSDGNISDEQTRQSLEDCSEASLYWSESEDETETEAGNELEWDSSYHDEMGEDCSERATETIDCNRIGHDAEKESMSNGDECPPYSSDGRSDVAESRL